MNWKQKICLWIGIAVIVAMGLFPPWVFQVKSGFIRKTGLKLGWVDAGYAFITEPPHYMEDEMFTVKMRATIDLAHLAVQWVIVVVFTGGFIVTLADKKGKKPKDEQ